MVSMTGYRNAYKLHIPMAKALADGDSDDEQGMEATIDATESR
jgi:hypothetical protein